MWLSRMSTNGINDNNKHLKHQKFKPSSGISQCYSFYCPSAQEYKNPYTRASYDTTSIQYALVTEGLYRRDILSALVGAGVAHIAIKVPNIFPENHNPLNLKWIFLSLTYIHIIIYIYTYYLFIKINKYFLYHNLKILKCLDSSALLAASLVSTEWQQLLLSTMYTTPRFRKRVQEAIFNGKPTISR